MPKLEGTFNSTSKPSRPSTSKKQFALLFEDTAPSLFQFFSINSEHSGEC